jgi:hypothetical protein
MAGTLGGCTRRLVKCGASKVAQHDGLILQRHRKGCAEDRVSQEEVELHRVVVCMFYSKVNMTYWIVDAEMLRD